MQRTVLRTDAGRNLALVLLAVPIVAVALPGGGDSRTHEVSVDQPIAFAHGAHVDYLRGGEHRREMIRMHLDALELDEEDAPAEMWTCTMCHDREENRRCLDCHELLLSSELRARKEIRTCLTCHRRAWSSASAGIPNLDDCLACHDESTGGLAVSTDVAADAADLSASAAAPSEGVVLAGDSRRSEEERLFEYARNGVDLPWIQIHTTPDHVYFSHTAHVRYAQMDCTQCHEDVSRLTAPPTQAVVFSMDSCVRCHEENAVSSDCLTCHQ